MRKYLNQHQSIQDKLLTFKTNGKAIIKLEKDKQEPLWRLLYILPDIYIYCTPIRRSEEGYVKLFSFEGDYSHI